MHALHRLALVPVLPLAFIALLTSVEAGAYTVRTVNGYATQDCFRVKNITFHFETNKDTDVLQSVTVKVFRNIEPYDELAGSNSYSWYYNTGEGGWYGFDCTWTPYYPELMVQGNSYRIEVTTQWENDAAPLRMTNIAVHSQSVTSTTALARTSTSSLYPVRFTLQNETDSTATATLLVYTSAAPCTLVSLVPPPCLDPGTQRASVIDGAIPPGGSLVLEVPGAEDEPYLHVEGELIVPSWYDTTRSKQLVSETWHVASLQLVSREPDPSDAGFLFRAVAPNPAGDHANIEFVLPSESAVRVTVVDVAGREMARLADRRFAAGEHRLAWDGRGRGAAVGPGVYFVRLDVNGSVVARRLVVLR